MARWFLIYALIIPLTVFSRWFWLIIEWSVGPTGL